MTRDEHITDPEFEALLRGRLQQLADHAPTTVPPLDQLGPSAPRSGLRGVRPRSGPWLAVVAGTALTGAGVAAFVFGPGDHDDPGEPVVPVETIGPSPSTLPAGPDPVPTSDAPSSTAVVATTVPPSVAPSVLPPAPSTTRPVASTTPSTGAPVPTTLAPPPSPSTSGPLPPPLPTVVAPPP